MLIAQWSRQKLLENSTMGATANTIGPSRRPRAASYRVLSSRSCSSAPGGRVLRAAYVAAWLTIASFIGWSVNLLFTIQQVTAEAGQLHATRTDLAALSRAWHDLNRPGNDVLESYSVDTQSVALSKYLTSYRAARSLLAHHEADDPVVATLLSPLDRHQADLAGLAQRVLLLAGEREKLRMGGATAAVVRTKEMRAASTMARMDRAFQGGLESIDTVAASLRARARELRDMQQANFRRLYLMLLVALVASALSIELVRRTIHQRETIREGADRIRGILDNIADGIVTTDEDGKIESCNPTAERIFRCSEDELVGRSFVALMRADCEGGYRTYRAGLNRSAKPSQNCAAYESVGWRADGSTFPMELVVSRVRRTDRTRFIHVVRDIGDRLSTERKLRQAASIFEYATEGIVVTDEKGTVQAVNPAYTEISEYTADELATKGLRVLRSDRHDDAFYHGLVQTLRDSGHWEGEIWNRRKDGEARPHWLNIRAIADARGRVTNYVGVTWDITAIKAADRIKDEFLATISHELRNPLTAIHGALRLIVGGVAGEVPGKAGELADVALSNCERLVVLITDILDIGKLEAGKLRFQNHPIELAPLIGQAVHANYAYTEQFDVAFETESLLTGVKVMGDRDRILQVLANLMSNAAKFAPAGDRVILSMHRRGSTIRVSVTDHGSGISEQFRPHVFRKFAQADVSDSRRNGGSGLGLSISKTIMEQLGGSMGFESQPCVETTFYFEMPELSTETSAETRSCPA